MNLGWVLSANEYKLKVSEGLPPDWHEHPPAALRATGPHHDAGTIATAAVYWLSDESRPVSGSVVDIEQYPMIGRNPD